MAGDSNERQRQSLRQIPSARRCRQRRAIGSAPQPAAAGGLIKDTTTANFAKDVIEESRNQPVLVDFWAPWCGPCKQLTPVIEKVVNEAKGRVKLVKMNIDDHPSIAGQLGIQSIPAVIAFAAAVRPMASWVPCRKARFASSSTASPVLPVADQAAEIEAALEEAEGLLAAGDVNGAAQLYGAVMQADPENAKALAGMAECMIAADQHQRAREVLTDLPEELAKDAGHSGRPHEARPDRRGPQARRSRRSWNRIWRAIRTTTRPA